MHTNIFISCTETIYVKKQTSYFHYLADVAWVLLLQLYWLFLKLTFIRNTILSVFSKIWDLNTSPKRPSISLTYLFRGTRRCVWAILILKTNEIKTLVQLFQDILTLSVRLDNIPSTCINITQELTLYRFSVRNVYDFFLSRTDDALQTRKETCEDDHRQ